MLDRVKHDAEAAGATASVHSLDFLDSSNLTRLRSLLHELDREYKGIDIAISNIGVTGHRSDIIGDTSDLNDKDSDIAAETKDAVLPAETGQEWGIATAERIVQINISAWQTFALTCWSLARARRLQNPSGPKPSLVLLSSSAAFFHPANFGQYSASKAYTYSLGQTLRILSMPYGIKVITVAPGFIESGMTHTMLQTGATTPVMQLGSPLKLARRIKQAEESNEGVVLYPFAQGAQLFAARGLNPLMESLGMWVGGAT
ncbi:hypothetical protein LTR85_002285 [Meristemomyces frigidus]|nr:hypothetical protein LTR85_002285 [Meristemomyces frigidus]